MITEEYFDRLTSAAYADLYLSSNDGGRIYWPWKMQPVTEAAQRYRDTCDHYIIDSAFQDDTVTNTDVFDTADRLDADMAVLADVLDDCDATIDAVLDGLNTYDDHPYDGQLLIPLQAPHDDCYQALEGHGDTNAYALGGLKDVPATDKLTALRQLRDIAGDDAHLHGLGFGVTDPLVAALHDDPSLLDSLDYSTPVQRALSADTTPGAERLSSVSALAGAHLIDDLRRLSSHTDPPDLPAATARQVTLDSPSDS